MTQRRILNEIVDPSQAKVLVERDFGGEVLQAKLDLTSLPRIESLLIGRAVAEVPPLVERLCGVCPVAHHLAGVQALEALAEPVELTASARQIRRLLQYGSVAAIHAVRYIGSASEDALTLRRFAKAAMAAAGSPSHFPATAVVGGVAAGINAEERDRCLAQLEAATAAALRIAQRELASPGCFSHFAGADVALVDSDGHLDLLGEQLRAVASDGRVILAGASANAWDDLVIEAIPGDPAPRPYLAALGQKRGQYRVGPVAQLRVGDLPTPAAAQLQADWFRANGNASAARAIMLLHCVEVISQLLKTTENDQLRVEIPLNADAGVGIGWVDGARGLLVHRYQSSADGTLVAATILTPTAQNEYWLSELLFEAVCGDAGDVSDVGDEVSATMALEDAIREADPCLPCVSALPGSMGLVVESFDGHNEKQRQAREGGK